MENFCIGLAIFFLLFCLKVGGPKVTRALLDFKVWGARAPWAPPPHSDAPAYTTQVPLIYKYYTMQVQKLCINNESKLNISSVLFRLSRRIMYYNYRVQTDHRTKADETTLTLCVSVEISRRPICSVSFLVIFAIFTYLFDLQSRGNRGTMTSGAPCPSAFFMFYTCLNSVNFILNKS